MGDKPSSRGLGDELRAMLADQGKASSSGPSASHAHAMALESRHISESGPSSSGFRHKTAGGAEGDAAFEEFASSTSRADTSMMEKAWQKSVEPLSAPTHAPPAAHVADDPARDSALFFAALGAEEKEEAAAPAPAPPIVPLTEAWRPPSPSQGTQMTREQYEMHVRLAEAQAGLAPEQPYRQAEAVEPPPDDPRLEEGVYAPSAELALQSVWDAQEARASRVKTFRETTHGTLPTSAYTQHRGQAVVDRLRGWLVRDGYTDEVYGLPPLTQRTFGEATMEAQDQQSEERRATAIRRLDALFKHLSTAQPEGGTPDDMEAWLQRNRA